MDKLSPELVVAIIVIIAGAIGYLFVQQGKHRDRLLAAELTQASIADDFDKLSTKITEGFKDVKGEIDKVNVRLDLFMHNEIDLLKGLLVKDKDNGK